MRPLPVLLLLLLIAVGMAAPGSVPSDKSADLAYQTLRDSKHFCDTAVGFAGTMPDEVIAFRKLLREPQAAFRFSKLLKEGSREGQMYALCGLYFVDQPAFAKALKSYETSTNSVSTFQGCIMSDMQVMNLVKASGEGVVRLESPEQTIQEWCKKYGHQNYTLDIAGGGWPVRLRGN